MTSPTAEVKADAGAFSVSSAVERMRTTAGWLITVFGALASFILVGIGFSQVLDVKPSWGLLLAFLGLCFALWGATQAIVAAAEVQAARPISRSQIILNSSDPIRFFPFSNAQEMQDRIIANRISYQNALREGQSVEDIAKETNSYIARLSGWADLNSTRGVYESFDRCIDAVKTAVILITFGTILFVCGLLLSKYPLGRVDLISETTQGTVEVRDSASPLYKTLVSCGTIGKDKVLTVPSIILNVRKPTQPVAKNIEYLAEIVPLFPDAQDCEVKTYTFNNIQGKVLIPATPD